MVPCVSWATDSPTRVDKVNIELTNAALFRDTVADEQALLDGALLPEANRERWLIEYSAPNTNKPQHLGHVRNNTLGQTLCSMLARVGHDVVPVNLVNARWNAASDRPPIGPIMWRFRCKWQDGGPISTPSCYYRY